jgi:hypothetical protein
MTLEKASRTRRRAFGETLMCAGAAMVLLLALVCLDDRVREVGLRIISKPTAEMASDGKRVGDLASVVVRAARQQTADHTPFVAFAFVAGVLVVFMLRT